MSDGRRLRLQRLRQAAVLAVLGAALGSYFLFGLDQWFSFEQLERHSQTARDLVSERPVQTTAIFMASLTLVTLLCIPAVALLQILSGFLFGPLLGVLLSVLAQTAGGALAFLIARSAFRESFSRLIGPYVGRLEAGFQANAFTYVVTLRMTPVMPYWVVNVAPSLLGVRFRPFVLGTLIGAVPLTFVYASFGAGLGEVVAAGGRPSLADLLEPKTVALLLAALCFAFAPLLVRRLYGRKVNPPPPPSAPGEDLSETPDPEPPR